MDKKIQLIAQFYISLMMATIFTGLFSFLSLGFTAEWLNAWPRAFVMAWPLAFTLSLGIGPLGFKLAFMTRKAFAAKAAKAAA